MASENEKTLDHLEQTLSEIGHTSMSTQRRKESLEHLEALRTFRARTQTVPPGYVVLSEETVLRYMKERDEARDEAINNALEAMAMEKERDDTQQQLEATRKALCAAGHCGDGNLPDLVQRALRERTDIADGKAEARYSNHIVAAHAALVRAMPDAVGTLAERIDALAEQVKELKAPPRCDCGALLEVTCQAQCGAV